MSTAIVAASVSVTVVACALVGAALYVYRRSISNYIARLRSSNLPKFADKDDDWRASGLEAEWRLSLYIPGFRKSRSSLVRQPMKEVELKRTSIHRDSLTTKAPSTTASTGTSTETQTLSSSYTTSSSTIDVPLSSPPSSPIKDIIPFSSSSSEPTSTTDVTIDVKETDNDNDNDNDNDEHLSITSSTTSLSVSSNGESSNGKTGRRLSLQAHVPQKIVLTNPSTRAMEGRRKSTSESNRSDRANSHNKTNEEGLKDDGEEGESHSMGDVYRTSTVDDKNEFADQIDDKVRRRLSTATSTRPQRSISGVSDVSIDVEKGQQPQ